MNEQEKKLKEKLLLSLIDHMDNLSSDRLAPKKAMSVEVAAPDEEKLESGLEKAKELLGSKDSPEPETETSDKDDSDEDRLKALILGAGDDDDDEEDKQNTKPFGRR